MPRSFCALSTATHNRRSSTILCSGDQRCTRSAPAYRLARTLGMTIQTMPPDDRADDPADEPADDRADDRAPRALPYRCSPKDFPGWTCTPLGELVVGSAGSGAYLDETAAEPGTATRATT